MTYGIANGILVRNHDRLAGGESIHIDAEDDLRLNGQIDLHPRFLRRVGGEQNEDSPVKRLRAAVLGKRNGELRSIRFPWNGAQRRNRDGSGGEAEREFKNAPLRNV